MSQPLPRRAALKSLGVGSTLIGLQTGESQAQTSQADPSNTSAPDARKSAATVNWSDTHDRIWIAENCWANPMEDWRIVDGAAECQTTGGDRNIHLITHQITDPKSAFEMSVSVARVAKGKKENSVGFKVGVHSDINEFRSNAFAKSGIRIGLVDDQMIVARAQEPIQGVADVQSEDLTLKVVGTPKKNQYELTLTVSGIDGKIIGSLTSNVPTDAVLGNLAIVNNFDSKTKKGAGSRYRFTDWTVTGAAVSVDSDRSFGPILWSMYSLSDSRTDEGFVMKMTALTGPLGEKDNRDVELQIERDGQWQSLATAALDPDAWTATFRIANWNEKLATPYRLVYRQSHPSGAQTESSWGGTIKANPSGRPLRLGALTCQKDYAFPYEPVANNLVKLDPDMLYFSGDQLYENHGGYGLIREPAVPAILNYLRKYYMFGWAFRDAMKDRPTLCIPDDHDVFQGNIWGEGGKPMDVKSGGASSNGGYIEPARMVNVVHKTNCSHHPDFADPKPVLQDISVYFGDMVYGGVSFAILGDRQFKSGPQHVETGSGRADHLKDPDIDPYKLDKPGLILLGERQENFLRKWASDWRGHTMKVLLSQTVFAGVATHHGGYNGYLVADLDSGGWPQSARNNAINILKPAMPLHINGDQHLTSLSQYGVEKQRDGCWAFCTPAIAAGYPRWWRPDEVGKSHENRPKHGMPNTGEYLDGFGNKVYVYAVGNPEVASKKNRYELAHQKASGFGLVTIDTQERTYTIDSFRFLIDPTDGNPDNQFPGWPVTIHQKENAGENRIG